jgi:hypothetical protein
VILVAVTDPSAARSSEDSTVMSPPAVLSRFAPLNCDAPMIDVTWLTSSSTSFWILALSTFSPVAATTFSLMSLRIFVICSAPAEATATVDSPRERASDTALNPLTSDSMTLEMAKIAELSLAVATALPVEIISCVFARLELTDCRVCRATMALLFVRMLDIGFSF